jgi:hypothetical protein
LDMSDLLEYANYYKIGITVLGPATALPPWMPQTGVAFY